ncbi:uncharacterized protein LOC129229449 [Uloborus diversus]|uniref:uncharacterized protein LOC129229449 n=1 Tax=Uloborus diversus TaxID=327109 RepID=UPI00240A30FB|nr:uncharacterized protein LOC129229449 [Uloborus diversus]XP_054719733.1 uncharacterized protein LOC129229449 [Uloborus diversus]XP_054719735.1 uncharacterized protein LOC129229449 [Uloborus diversus]
MAYAYEEFNTEMSDADSVDRWISLCCQMEVSPILFYQKEDFVGGEGKHDEFLLVIMTEFQRQILLNSARQIVCVDSLYRKKGGRFYLTVMFIMDEMDLAFPVAFCISNKVDKMVLIQFFASISQQTGSLECQYFMSDSESCYYEAWKEVMNDESKWIWSLWYVDSRFRTQLKIFKGDTQKRQDVYKVMRVLLECPNQIVFNCMFENFIKDLMSSPTSKDLGKFIQSKYGSNFEMWARCYQKDIELGTVIHLEIMHRTLRYCCREGRKTRLDKFIYVLMKLIRDKMLDRLSNVLDEEKITMAVEAINTCHTMGLEIVPENITVLSDKIWLVRSENPDENAYVTVDNATCLEHCNLKCIECDICVHMYSCTCLNNLINANMCDHIHAVVWNFVSPHFSPAASDVDDIMQEVADTPSDVLEIFKKDESYDELLQSVLKRSHQVYKLVQASKNKLNSLNLGKLLNKMNECVDICTGKHTEPEPPKPPPPAVPAFPYPLVSSVPRPAASMPATCRSIPSNAASPIRLPAPVKASSSSSGPPPSSSVAPTSLSPAKPDAVTITSIRPPDGKPVYVLQPVFGNNASVVQPQFMQTPFLQGLQGQFIQNAAGVQYVVVLPDKSN